MGVCTASEGEPVSAHRRDDGNRACDEIELESGTVRLHGNGIVAIIPAGDVHVTAEAAQAIGAAMRRLTDRPSPVLADIRGLRGAGILTARYVAGPVVAKMTRRLALLTGSPVSRMIGNAFMGLSKPPYPTRLFTEEDAAVIWLLAGSAENAAADQDATRPADDAPAA